MSADPRDARASRDSGAWYSYAIVRLVPHVERGEFVLLHAAKHRGTADGTPREGAHTHGLSGGHAEGIELGGNLPRTPCAQGIQEPHLPRFDRVDCH